MTRSPGHRARRISIALACAGSWRATTSRPMTTCWPAPRPTPPGTGRRSPRISISSGAAPTSRCSISLAARPGRSGSPAAGSITSPARSTGMRQDPAGERTALIWEGDDGAVRRLTFRELQAGDEPPGERPARARRRARGPRRDLHADAAGDGGRGARPGQARRHLPADVLRVRAGGARLAAARRRGEPAHHRRWRPPPRQDGPHEGGRRRGDGPGAERAHLPRPAPHRRGCAVDRRPRRLVARRRSGRVARLRDRSRPPPTSRTCSSTPPARPAARRARCTSTPGSRSKPPTTWPTCFDLQRGRHALLVDRSRLDDGSLADLRRADRRRDAHALRGHARLSRTPTASGGWSRTTGSPSSASRRPRSAP